MTFSVLTSNTLPPVMSLEHILVLLHVGLRDGNNGSVAELLNWAQFEEVTRVLALNGAGKEMLTI